MPSEGHSFFMKVNRVREYIVVLFYGHKTTLLSARFRSIISYYSRYFRGVFVSEVFF